MLLSAVTLCVLVPSDAPNDDKADRVCDCFCHEHVVQEVQQSSCGHESDDKTRNGCHEQRH